MDNKHVSYFSMHRDFLLGNTTFAKPGNDLGLFSFTSGMFFIVLSQHNKISAPCHYVRDINMARNWRCKPYLSVALKGRSYWISCLNIITGC